MTHTAVSLEELLGDFDATAAKWKEFFAANPAAAEVPTDISRSRNVGELVWHIYAASFRHAERLFGEPGTDIEGQTPVRTVAGAWELHARASTKLRQLLEGADDAAMKEVLTMKFRTGGEVSATRRKLCLHIFVHAIRHWAQIATIVRQNGLPPGWLQDIVFSEAIH